MGRFFRGFTEDEAYANADPGSTPQHHGSGMDKAPGEPVWECKDNNCGAYVMGNVSDDEARTMRP